MARTVSFAEEAEKARIAASENAYRALRVGEKPVSVIVDELGYAITKALCHLHFEELKNAKR